MSLAVVSERRLLKTVSTNLPHPVSVAPLPFEKRLEVVFVRNRPRRLSRELFDNETNKSTTKRPGTSRVHRSRTSVQQEREMRLNRLFLLGNSSREFLKYPINHGRIPIASSQSSVLESGSTLTGLPASSMLPPSTTLTSAPTQQAAIAQSATLNFEMSRGLINQMQASPNRSSQDSYEPVDPDKPSPVQLSFILDKLREELPAFFEQPHTYSMYSSDMIFTNRLVPFSQRLYGRDSYRSFLAFSKTTLRLFYSNLKLEVLRIAKDPFEGKVTVRWRISGRPLLRSGDRVILDGFSEFIVSTEGQIVEHKMDRLTPSKHHSLVRSLLPKRLEAFLPNRQPTITSTQSS